MTAAWNGRVSTAESPAANDTTTTVRSTLAPPASEIATSTPSIAPDTTEVITVAISNTPAAAHQRPRTSRNERLSAPQPRRPSISSAGTATAQARVQPDARDHERDEREARAARTS